MSDWAAIYEDGTVEWFMAAELAELITDLNSWCAFAHMIMSGKPARMMLPFDGQPPTPVKVIRATRHGSASTFERPYG